MRNGEARIALYRVVTLLLLLYHTDTALVWNSDTFLPFKGLALRLLFEQEEDWKKSLREKPTAEGTRRRNALLLPAKSLDNARATHFCALDLNSSSSIRLLRHRDPKTSNTNQSPSSITHRLVDRPFTSSLSSSCKSSLA